MDVRDYGCLNDQKLKETFPTDLSWKATYYCRVDCCCSFRSGMSTTAAVPKKPACAYSLFLKENMPIIAAAHPALSPQEVLQLTSSSWKSLVSEKRLQYQTRAKQLWDEYLEARNDYVKQYGHPPPAKRSKTSRSGNADEQRKPAASSSAQSEKEHRVFSQFFTQNSDAQDSIYWKSIDRALSLKDRYAKSQRGLNSLRLFLNEVKDVADKAAFSSEFLGLVKKALIENFKDLPLPDGFRVADGPVEYLSKADVVAEKGNSRDAAFISTYKATMSRLKLPTVADFREQSRNRRL